MPRSLTQIAEGLGSRQFSARELLLEHFAVIDEREASVHAFISQVDREQLLAMAHAVDEARAATKDVPPLAGAPISIKDNIAVAGVALTCGSRILDSYVSPFDAAVVERVRQAGLLVVGKTNMDEFGFGSTTENSAFGPTRNPVNTDFVPGGTSGGAAASVAASMVPCALGSDTGGSVRQPAALCGVVGFRPSYGAVSRYGLVSYASSMDQVGPLARSVGDVQALFRLVVGVDPRDATTQRISAPGASSEVRAARLGVPIDYLGEGCDPEVRAATHRVADLAETLGWDVQEISLSSTEAALAAYYVVASVEAASNLARYDGVRYGLTASGDGWAEQMRAVRGSGFGSEAKRRILLGTFASSAGYAARYYEAASRARSMVIADFERAFADVDLILSPVSPTPAWRLGEKVDDPMSMYLADVFSVPASLAGVPGVVLPVGTNEEGLPLGLQLVGRHGADHLVLERARILEEALALGS